MIFGDGTPVGPTPPPLPVIRKPWRRLAHKPSSLIGSHNRGRNIRRGLTLIEPMFDREKAISTLDGDHCACPACHGDLTDSSLSARGWRHCKVCRCAWKVEEVHGQRYAMHIAGRVHAVPGPQQSRRTAGGEIDSEG